MKKSARQTIQTDSPLALFIGALHIKFSTSDAAIHTGRCRFKMCWAIILPYRNPLILHINLPE